MFIVGWVNAAQRYFGTKVNLTNSLKPPLVVPTAVIYGLILVFGILGNGCTCLVIFKVLFRFGQITNFIGKFQNRPMQNPTNYYLFSLAISDLLLLVVGLPVELYGVFDAVYPYKVYDTNDCLQFGKLFGLSSERLSAKAGLSSQNSPATPPFLR
jgi:hypothetical protein